MVRAEMKPRVDSPPRAPLFRGMKTPFPLLVAALFIPVGAALAVTPTIPQREPADAFQKMTEDWPFALATPVVAAAEPVKGWASNYYVGAIGKNYDGGKEEVFVGVKSKDGQASFSLYGNESNTDGISVGGIEWSEEIGKSRVTLKKGQEFATITFDEATLKTPAAPSAMQQQRPGMPNVPGMKQPMIRPQGAPMPVPRPANIPQPMPQAGVPLPGGPSNTNAPANTNAINPQNQPNNPKQRVRVIKSTP